MAQLVRSLRGEDSGGRKTRRTTVAVKNQHRMETIRRSLGYLNRLSLRVADAGATCAHHGHAHLSHHHHHKQISYGQLLSRSLEVAEDLDFIPQFRRAQQQATSAPSSSFARHPNVKRGPRVAVMAPPGEEYLAATWATWLKGSICVPLAVSNPARELEYVVRDAGCSVMLATPEYLDTLLPVAKATGAALLPLDASASESAHGHGHAHDHGASASLALQVIRQLPPKVQSYVGSPGDSGALIIYTSGTTGKPKGVLHSHGGLQAQMEGMIGSWGWSAGDRLLHALPLHHIHGIVNALYTPLLAGASLEVHRIFSPELAWESILSEGDQAGSCCDPPPTVFMGVPTMYARLISTFDSMSPDQQRRATAAASKLRLYVSGSSACPVPLMEGWKRVSGAPHIHLERYGMTEIGMALSNPYQPAEDRRPGTVGTPLPGVEAKIDFESAAASGSGSESESGGDERASAARGGELLIKSTGMFVEYWNKPDKTQEAFTGEGFFRTGDTVVCEETSTSQGGRGYYRILGRTSVDILKTRGFKVSALQVEDALLENPKVGECAVFGLDDPAQGQVVSAVVAFKKGQGPADPSGMSTKELRGLELEMRRWMKEYLPPYAIPEKWFFLRQVPRNAMGKVNKKELAELFGNKV